MIVLQSDGCEHLDPTLGAQAADTRVHLVCAYCAGCLEAPAHNAASACSTTFGKHICVH